MNYLFSKLNYIICMATYLTFSLGGCFIQNVKNKKIRDITERF